MRITDITVVLHQRQATASASFGPARPVPLGVLRIETDEGIEGNAFLSSPGPGPAAIADQIVTVVKPWLLGADPLDIGKHWRRMESLVHYLSPHTVGTVDIALWDIAGKAAGLPVHRLLGTCRDRIPAYFSSAHHQSRGAVRGGGPSTGSSRAGRATRSTRRAAPGSRPATCPRSASTSRSAPPSATRSATT